jgi:peptide/nickel transport system permease protein
LLGFIVRRLLALIPLMLIVSFFVYSLVLFLPGDPAVAIAGGTEATPEEIEEVRQQLGLDDPLLTQYGRWLKNAVQGDLGESLYTKRSVSDEITRRFPVTFSVAIGAIAISLVLGTALGIFAGLRRGAAADRGVTVFTSLGLAIPSFWLALMLVILLSVNLRWLDSIGYVKFGDDPYQWARHLIMPWIALGIGAAATVARQVRGALVDVMDQDYIRTARSKGLPGHKVVSKHALKNAAMPALTVLGIQFAYLLGGTVIIESIFSIPGLGTYIVSAISGRDLPVIQGTVLMMAVIFVVLNLVVDVLYAVVNPKVRLS